MCGQAHGSSSRARSEALIWHRDREGAQAMAHSDGKNARASAGGLPWSDPATIRRMVLSPLHGADHVASTCLAVTSWLRPPCSRSDFTSLQWPRP